MSIWFTIFQQPLFNILIFFYEALASNLGWAIIATTTAIRLALIPLTLPSMRSAQKIQLIKPQLDKLKKKFADDKQALAQAQLELYRKNGINPAGGILPIILQFVILIALFQVFHQVLDNGGMSISDLNAKLYPFLQIHDQEALNTQFFYLNLTKPDVFTLPNPINIIFFTITVIPGAFLIASAVTQFFSSKWMMLQTPKPAKKENNDSPEDMMQSLQTQMLYVMPIMTLVIGLQFASGLVLYWLAFSMVMMGQQMWTKRRQTQVAVVEKE